MKQQDGDQTSDVYRRRPVDVRARQWRGDNEAEVRSLTSNFEALDEPCGDDPEATAQLMTDPHSTWELMYVGDWAVLGAAGVVRMTDGQFRAEYEPVGLIAQANLTDDQADELKQQFTAALSQPQRLVVLPRDPAEEASK